MNPRATRFAGFAALAVAANALGANGPTAGWTDLWKRPDQQAQDLLEAGKAADAARLFDDPRRRAYAEIRARQYETAAKELKDLGDPESEYNRGNALARSGDLKGSLGAYDAALRQAPKGSDLYRDALHNRELVEKQLQSQQDKSQQDKSQRDKQGQGKDKDHDQSPRDQGQQGQGGEPQQQAQNRAQQPNQGQQGQRKNQQAQDQKAQDQQQQDRQAMDKQAQSQQATNPSRAQAQPGKDSQAAAQADARAALDSQQRQQSQPPQPPPNPSQAAQAAQQDRAGQQARVGRDSDRPDAKDLAAGNAPKPETEQQLALDQWLRWIPDDPAGLLRRKFMIEHMLKQREETL